MRSGVSGVLVLKIQRWGGAYGENRLRKSACIRGNQAGILLPNRPPTEALGYLGESFPCQSQNTPPPPQTLLSSGEGHSQFLPQQVQSSRRGQGKIPEESGLFWPTPA